MLFIVVQYLFVSRFVFVAIKWVELQSANVSGNLAKIHSEVTSQSWGTCNPSL